MPTYGRVPLRGVVALATTLDHVGPMTRSAIDAALLLQVMAGHDPLDPTSVDVPVPDYARETTGPVRGLRVGVPRGYLWDLLAPAIGAAVEDGARPSYAGSGSRSRTWRCPSGRRRRTPARS